jgi:thiol-disulfide isomerase/thioredoxin
MFRRFAPLAALATLALFFAGAAAAADKDKDKDKGDKDENPDKIYEEMLGKPAPEIGGDFAVNGKPVKLSDLKGKVVLVDMFAVWCKPCIEGFPEVLDLNKSYKDKGLETVGVVFYEGRYRFDKAGNKLVEKDKDEKPVSREDEQEMFKGFVALHKLDYPVQAVSKDDEKKVADAYKRYAFPTIFLIDRKGNLRYAHIGHSPDEAKAAEEAKALRAKVEELLKEKE